MRNQDELDSHISFKFLFFRNVIEILAMSKLSIRSEKDLFFVLSL